MLVFNTLKQAKEGISPKQDMRGRHTAHNVINRDDIKANILKYNPCVSHYRREHAPNRKYLPSELSIAQMYSDFQKEQRDSIKCSYDLFRTVIAEMNISFVKLGHEECERCTKFKLQYIMQIMSKTLTNLVYCVQSGNSTTRNSKKPDKFMQNLLMTLG